MPKTVMVSATVVCFLMAAITSGLYAFSDSGIYLSLAITSGITTYHFGMRLMVGMFYNAIMKNHVDYNRKWFRVYFMGRKTLLVFESKKMER